MLNIILGKYLWPEEVKDTVCENFGEKIFDDVSSQQECQQRCIGKIGCVGISYSHKDGYTKYCYVCMDDDLTYGTLDFGFYRRPGIVDVWLLNSKIVSNNFL